MPRTSTVVTLGSIGVLSAIIIASCQGPDEVTADCVDTTSRAPDGSYKAVDDRFCEGGSHFGYYRVYGGTPRAGRLYGGTTVKPADATITTRSGRVVQRGGFGFRFGGGG